MKSIAKVLKPFGHASLVIALASCGGDDPAPLDVPAASGMRVVYAAATNASDPDRESLFAADTGAPLTGNTRLFQLAADARASFATVSLDGRYYGALIQSDGTSCPTVLKLVDQDDGETWKFMGDQDCVHSIRWGATGTAVALNYTPKNASSASLAIGSVPGFESALATVSTQMPSMSSGGAYAFSGDGQVIAWAEDSGLFVSDDFVGGQFPSVANARSADSPGGIRVSADGTFAVYRAPGEMRFRVTDLTYGAPQSSSYLTAALAPGDTLTAFVLSPNDTHLLYSATVGGQDQLWLVALTAPLTEQRVDGTASGDLGLGSILFAFNSTGTRFAWIGTDGNPVYRVFQATVAAPTTTVALTPTTQNVAAQLAWTGADTLVYTTYEAVNIGDVLRSVMVTAPLATVALSNTAARVPGVDRLTVCSDGTVVYQLHDRAGLAVPEAPSTSTALYAAVPMVAASGTLLAGPIMTPARGIGVFACE